MVVEYKIKDYCKDKKVFLLENEQYYVIFFESENNNSKRSFKNFEYFFEKNIDLSFDNFKTITNGEIIQLLKTIYNFEIITKLFTIIIEYKYEYSNLDEILVNISNLLSISDSDISKNSYICGFIGELIYIRDFLNKGLTNLTFRKFGDVLDFYEEETNKIYEVKMTKNFNHEHHFSKNQIDRINNDSFNIFSICADLNNNSIKKIKISELLKDIYSFNNFELNNNIKKYYGDFILNENILDIDFEIRDIKEFKSDNYKDVCKYNNSKVDKIDIIIKM